MREVQQITKQVLVTSRPSARERRCACHALLILPSIAMQSLDHQTAVKENKYYSPIWRINKNNRTAYVEASARNTNLSDHE